ncbi:UvrD-helicase domain-containing protein [Kitasatospora sp. NPDC052868]|uniref:UvrD-helicase domain-containing protein n=1 Tax=Kitasatospora sp. NPDC052868 TaxID=3364060 RepID=UPI0037CC1087
MIDLALPSQPAASLMTYEARKDQQDVIDSTAPVVLVTGGAGTGKTATAVAAARAHLKASGRDLGLLRQNAARSGQRTQLPAATRVLFLSFSRPAVAQIIDRAAGVIGPLRPRLEVATFHGFAWRIISSIGAHHGFPPPQYVLSEANRLVPGAPPGLTYNQLMPAAAELLTLPKVSEHYAGRYSLVICDEFQDTDATEWEFVQQIAPGARRILLGDVNQSIFQGSFKPGVDPAARIAAAMAHPGAVRIDLEPASYRAPSGVLPAAAEAARTRDFSNPAFGVAASHGRLAVTRYTSGSGYEQVIDLTRAAREKGHTVSVFTHTNVATTALSDALTEAGLAHEQIGFTEAHAEVRCPRNWRCCSTRWAMTTHRSDGPWLFTSPPACAAGTCRSWLVKCSTAQTRCWNPHCPTWRETCAPPGAPDRTSRVWRKSSRGHTPVSAPSADKSRGYRQRPRPGAPCFFSTKDSESTP